MWYSDEKGKFMTDERPKWLFDEFVHIGVDYTDVERVADYDRQHEGFRDYKNEARKIFEALGLSKSSIVLDMGCGTGGLTMHCAWMCRHVYAVDISKQMIAALEHKIQEQGLQNVTPVQSGFLTYQHAGETVNAVIANISLHHLPDFWKQIAVCKLCDILKPGGKLFLADVVYGFDPRNYQKEIGEWLAGMEEIAGQSMARETAIHVREEFSTWDWIMKGILERAGFQVEEDFEVVPNMRAYVCSKVETEP
jgi:ubiquinone/menaquinone biosynthesis C-methylase UbiE